MFREGRQDCNNLLRDVQTNAYLEGSGISRTMSFDAHECPSWPGSLNRVSHGVRLLGITREIAVYDMARYLHLSVGNMYIRPRPGQTYICENGAFKLFNIFLPESLFQRRKEYTAYVDGRVCRLDKITQRADGQTFPTRYIFFSPHYGAKRYYRSARRRAMRIYPVWTT